MTIAEVHRELIGFYAFGLDKETIGKHVGECQQCDIIGQEVGVRHFYQRIDMQRVAPNGVGSHVGLRARLEGLLVKGNHLTLLCKAEVAIGILQGISAISARSHTFYYKVSTTVGTRYTQHRFGLEGRISQIIIQAYHDALDGFEIAGIEHIARYFEGINLFACGEAIGIATHRVILVVIADGIAEVDGISGIRHQ